MYFLSFRIFEQLALAPKNRVCPGIFHCIEYTFYIQDFWATCTCPEKQGVPWIHYGEHVFFIIQDFWATCACPEKQSCPGIFHCIELFFYHPGFWRTRACPENRVRPEIFQTREGRCPPDSYACACFQFPSSPTVMNLRQWPKECYLKYKQQRRDFLRRADGVSLRDKVGSC